MTNLDVTTAWLLTNGDNLKHLPNGGLPALGTWWQNLSEQERCERFLQFRAASRYIELKNGICGWPSTPFHPDYDGPDELLQLEKSLRQFHKRPSNNLTGPS